MGNLKDERCLRKILTSCLPNPLNPQAAVGKREEARRVSDAPGLSNYSGIIAYWAFTSRNCSTLARSFIACAVATMFAATPLSSWR
jgi:hypothetical protein